MKRRFGRSYRDATWWTISRLLGGHIVWVRSFAGSKPVIAGTTLSRLVTFFFLVFFALILSLVESFGLAKVSVVLSLIREVLLFFPAGG